MKVEEGGNGGKVGYYRVHSIRTAVLVCVARAAHDHVRPLLGDHDRGGVGVPRDDGWPAKSSSNSSLGESIQEQFEFELKFRMNRGKASPFQIQRQVQGQPSSFGSPHVRPAPSMGEAVW